MPMDFDEKMMLESKSREMIFPVFPIQSLFEPIDLDYRYEQDHLPAH